MVEQQLAQLGARAGAGWTEASQSNSTRSAASRHHCEPPLVIVPPTASVPPVSRAITSSSRAAGAVRTSLSIAERSTRPTRLAHTASSPAAEPKLTTHEAAAELDKHRARPVEGSLQRIGSVERCGQHRHHGDDSSAPGSPPYPFYGSYLANREGNPQISLRRCTLVNVNLLERLGHLVDVGSGGPRGLGANLPSSEESRGLTPVHAEAIESQPETERPETPHERLLRLIASDRCVLLDGAAAPS